MSVTRARYFPLWSVSRATASSPEAAKAETQEKLAEQQRLNQELETVKDAVRVGEREHQLAARPGDVEQRH